MLDAGLLQSLWIIVASDPVFVIDGIERLPSSASSAQCRSISAISDSVFDPEHDDVSDADPLEDDDPLRSLGDCVDIEDGPSNPGCSSSSVPSKVSVRSGSTATLSPQLSGFISSSNALIFSSISCFIWNPGYLGLIVPVTIDLMMFDAEKVIELHCVLDLE